MTSDHLHHGALELRRATEDRQPLDGLQHAPRSLDEGYAIQRAGHDLAGAPLVGWKVGCTSAEAQLALGVDEPQSGRYPAAHVLPSGATIDIDAFVTAPNIEIEVGFRLLEDLGDRPANPLDLADAVEVLPCIEMVASRFANWHEVGANSLAADNAIGARMVVGEPLGLDARAIRALDRTPVALLVDDHLVVENTGAKALGHPLNVLSWLIGHAAGFGQVLATGQVVITGTCTGLVPATVGTMITGRVDDGDVTLSLTDSRGAMNNR